MELIIGLWRTRGVKVGEWMVIFTCSVTVAILMAFVESTCLPHIQLKQVLTLLPHLLQVQQNVVFLLAVLLGRPVVVQRNSSAFVCRGNAVDWALPYVARTVAIVVPSIILFVILKGTYASRFVLYPTSCNIVFEMKRLLLEIALFDNFLSLCCFLPSNKFNHLEMDSFA